MTLFATAVAYFAAKGHDVSLTNSVVPLFSVVVRILFGSCMDCVGWLVLDFLRSVSFWFSGAHATLAL